MSDRNTSPILPANPVLLLAKQALGIKPLVISPKRKYLALLLAGVVDVIQFTVLAPSTGAGAMSPVQWGVDIATTILLVAILGWNWRLLAAFVFELIPAVALFPTWSALILTITALTPGEERSDAAPAPAVAEGSPPSPGLPSPVPPPDFAAPSGLAVTPTPPGEPEKFPGVYHQRKRAD
jgi:hypothetical protein